jgi:hypothetical protein
MTALSTIFTSSAPAVNANAVLTLSVTAGYDPEDVGSVVLCRDYSTASCSGQFEAAGAGRAPGLLEFSAQTVVR